MSEQEPVVLEDPVPVPEFSPVEDPAHLAVTGGGWLVVTDGRTILAADPARSTVRRLGRAGEGPGEFRRIGGISGLEQDSVMVWDPVLMRVTIWRVGRDAPDRVVVASSPTGFFEGRPISPAAAGGRVLLSWGRGIVRSDGTPDSVLITSLRLADPAAQDTVAILDDIAWARLGPALGPRSPFGPRPVYATGRSGKLVWGDGVDYCFRVSFATGSGFPQEVCRGWSKAPVGEARQRLPPELRSSIRHAAVVEGVIEAQDYSGQRNSYDALRVDALDRVWVRVVDSTHRHHPQYMGILPELRPSSYTWELFGAQGGLLMRIAVPSRFDPLAFTLNHIFGLYEEEDGSRSIRVAPLPAGYTTAGP